MIELLRRHIAPPAYYCDVLADLLDPAKTDYGQLSFRKSKCPFRNFLIRLSHLGFKGRGVIRGTVLFDVDA